MKIPVKGNVVDITKLNIVEVTRKKIKKLLLKNWQKNKNRGKNYEIHAYNALLY